MSWETTVTKAPCRCGKGTIVVTDRSDDWGRTEHHETMKCDDCEQRYVYAQVRERNDRPFQWITREHAAELEEARACGERERKAATARARAQLGDALVRALAPHGSRKAIWEGLRHGGVYSPDCWSFAEFNRRIRAQGRDAAIRSVIDGGNVEAVRRLIGKGA
jgi:hypothetical protein